MKKQKHYLTRLEAVSAYLLYKQYGKFSKVAKKLEVTDGTIALLVKNVNTVLSGGTVDVQKNKQAFEDACYDLVKLLTVPKPAKQEQLPLQPKLTGRERVKWLLQELPEALNEAVAEDNAEVRKQLENITQAVSQVTNKNQRG